MDETKKGTAAGSSLTGIVVNGQTSTASDVVYEEDLDSGQFTSPVIVRGWDSEFVGVVINENNNVRALIFQREARDGGAQIAVHEVILPGTKVEGPGLSLFVDGDDLLYAVTGHRDQDGTRLDVLARGRFAGLAAPRSPVPNFSDVPADADGQAILALAQRGIVGGTAPGQFSPNNNATRKQVAKLIARALKWVQ